MPDHLERDQGGAELPEDNPVQDALAELLLGRVRRRARGELAAAPPPRRPGPPIRVRWVRPNADGSCPSDCSQQ